MFDDAKKYINTVSQSNPLLCKMLLYYSTKFQYDTLLIHTSIVITSLNSFDVH